MHTVVQFKNTTYYINVVPVFEVKRRYRKKMTHITFGSNGSCISFSSLD